MNPTTGTGPARLRYEILEEAGRRREEILREAREAVDAVAAHAEQEAARLRAERLRAAELEAKRRTQALLATVPVEAARLRAARVEQILEAIRARAFDQIRARSRRDGRETLIRLCAAAVQRMAGGTFQLRLPEADWRAWGEGLADAIGQALDQDPVSLLVGTDAGLPPGDAVVEDPEGRQVWNLNPCARLARCWPELRQQLAAQTGIMEPEVR